MLILATLLGVYLFLLTVIAWVSVHPFRTPHFLSPAQLGAPQESVEFLCDGNRIRGWWVPAEDPTAVAVLTHGYMMNRSELVAEAVALWRRGVSCLLIDFRAQGTSGGKLCTVGNLERRDVREAVLFARKRCPGVKTLGVGSSMGSAAIALALADDPALFDAIVLDSAYSRLPSAILGWWRFLGGEFLKSLLAPTVWLAWPMVGFNPFRIDVSQALGKVDKPVLFLHGEADSLALPSEARRNFASARGPKRIVWFERCGHSQGRLEFPDRYHAALLAFCEENGMLRADVSLVGARE